MAMLKVIYHPLLGYLESTYKIVPLFSLLFLFSQPFYFSRIKSRSDTKRAFCLFFSEIADSIAISRTSANIYPGRARCARTHTYYVHAHMMVHNAGTVRTIYVLSPTHAMCHKAVGGG